MNDLKPVRVLSLFNGYSGGMMALESAGIPVETYYSSEIDKYANKVTQAIFPNTIQLGDVVMLRKLLELTIEELESLKSGDSRLLFNNSYFADVIYKINIHIIGHVIDIKTKGVDFVFGGSPCQGFSMAGKQLNFEDERSALFFEFVKIKDILQPRFWLLENVRMKKHIENAISKILGKKPYKINSNLVSAQNRYRLYWSNIRLTTIPKDQKILLKDILEPLEDVDEKYFLSEKMIDFITNPMRLKKGYTAINPKKSTCLTARMYASWNGTFWSNSGGYHSDMDVLCVPSALVEVRSEEGKRIRKENCKKGKDTNPYRAKELQLRKDGKSNCLMATNLPKDNMIIQKSRGFNKGGLFEEKSPTLTSNSFEHNNHVLQRKNYLQVVRNGNQSQNDRIHFTENKMCALTASRTETKLNIIHNYIFRRLTPRECGRLQTIPEKYIDIMLSCGVSDSQIYKMLGNGWTVEIIAFIFSKTKF